MSAQPSFADFYEQSKDRVYRAVLAVVRDRHRAEDAVAHGFLRALEHWDSVGAMADPTAWVIRVAFNGYRSDWRIWRREGREPQPNAGAPARYPSDATTISMVNQLPKRQREVVALRLLADLSEQQTAVMLGISPKTVSVHLHNAVERLRVQFDALQQEETLWMSQQSPAE